MGGLGQYETGAGEYDNAHTVTTCIVAIKFKGQYIWECHFHVSFSLLSGYRRELCQYEQEQFI